ncbi:MAG: phage tail sheath family protein [Clostridia bacterium]
MALGGGSFTNYNKLLPGTYINFVSSSSATGEVSDRGVCAIGIELSWGKEDEAVAVTVEDFWKNSIKYFGYSCIHDNLRGMRDLFKNASLVYVYRLGHGVKASNSYGTAACSGKCGNNIQVKVTGNIDNSKYYDVITYYNGIKKDVQTVQSASELTDNDFVVWDKTATLTPGGAVGMTGGGDAVIKGEDYQEFLDCIETVSFNVLAVASVDSTVNNLIAAFTKRMREDRGVKFQSVLYRCEADDIGVINVDNAVFKGVKNEAELVWYVAGASAGCKMGKSLVNHAYSGNYYLYATYTQSELEECIKKGKFVFHKVGNEYRVLADINSLVTTSAEVGEIFCENQTVRLVDQIAYDDAYLFKTKYLGIVPNDEAGRISLWNDLVEHRKSLQKMRAIENFKDEDISVEKGTSKTSVVITSAICPINSMAQLYITTTLE